MKKLATPLIGLAAAAVLTLTACGGTPAAEDSGASESSTPTKLNVQVAPIQYEPALIAQSEGYFEEVGLDVEITFGAGPAEMIASVLSGDSDIVATSWSALAQAVAEGSPIAGIAGNGIVSPDVDSSGILVLEDSPIKTIADLEGKNVGVVGIGTGTEIPLYMAAAAAGVADPAGTIAQVAIPYAGMQAALESGQVDAVFPADSFYFQILESGARQVSNPVREYQGGNPTTIWTSKIDWIEQNVETVENFQAAMEKAFAFYNDPANEDAVLQFRADHMEVPLEELPSRFMVPMDIAPNLTVLQEQLDAVNKYSTMPKVSAEDLFWSGAPTQ